MKKKMVSMLLLGCMMVSLVACGGNEANNDIKSENDNISQNTDVKNDAEVSDNKEKESSKNDYKLLENSLVDLVTSSKEELEEEYGSYAPELKDFDRNMTFSLYGKTFSENFTIQDIFNGLYLSKDSYKYTSVEEFMNAGYVLKETNPNDATIDVSTEPKEDKNFFDGIYLFGTEKGKPVGVKDAYENNRWCHVVSHWIEAAEILSLEDEHLLKDGSSVLFNFGVPDEIIYIGSSLDDYFDYSYKVNQKNVGLVYKFNNFTMVAVYNELSGKDADSLNKDDAWMFMFMPHEAYENHFDTMFWYTEKGKVTLWTKENGVAF